MIVFNFFFLNRLNFINEQIPKQEVQEIVGSNKERQSDNDNI
jgi:hypothetical protein